MSRNSIHLPARFAIALISNLLLVPILVLSSQSALSQESSLERVVVLHGVWEAGPWDLDIDRGIVQALNLSKDGDVQISFQYLGIDVATDEARLQQVRRNIESMIRQQGITLIVAIQALASRFALDLNLAEPIPRLLLLPNAETIAEARQVPDVAVVESASRVAIDETLAQLLLLEPDARTITVVGGNNGDDLVYVNQIREAAQNYSARVEFDYQIGVAPEILTARLQELSPDEPVLTLPFSAYTDENGELAPVGSIYFDRMIASVSAPLFGIYDRLLGQGLTGGSLSSTEGYASAVGRLVRARIENGQWPAFLTSGDATTVYDWQEVERFGLDLDRLSGPVRLINDPETLWESNPLLFIAVANVIGILLLIVLVMGLLLNRSKKARAAIAASERLAREKEAQYRLLATNTVDVIWTWNGKTEEVIYCSPSIEKLTGFTVEEFLDRPLHEHITVESFQRCVELYRRGPDARDRLIEVEHYTKSGGSVWCEMSAHPIDNDGDKDIWVGVTRDISQRKKEEEHRQRLEASVRQNQKFESLGTLAGGIAHDFNNVLGVMMGLIDLLTEEVGRRDKPGRLLDKLDNSAQKAKRLVQRILAFARHREGDKEVLDLAELTAETFELLGSGLPPEVRLETSMSEEQARVKVDRTQIEQIILNVASNAIEALSQTGGTIRCSLDTVQITAPADYPHGSVEPGLYAKLAVQDDGPGMSKQVVERIFDPFYTSKDMGSGMGLAIVRNVIVQHDGAIDITTKPGLGTRFDIFLPCTDEPIPESQTANLEIDIGKSMSILLIDDQPEILETTQMMLERLGHRCETARSPVEGLAILEDRHESLDLVITDYSMPNMNGLDLIKQCATRYPELQYVISTGYGDALPRNPMLDSQRPLRTLRKPYSFKELKALVNQVLGEAIAA